MHTSLQVVWSGLSGLLVLCHAFAVQVLQMAACSRLVALHLLPAKPVGYLPHQPGKHLMLTLCYLTAPAHLAMCTHTVTSQQSMHKLLS